MKPSRAQCSRRSLRLTDVTVFSFLDVLRLSALHVMLIRLAVFCDADISLRSPTLMMGNTLWSTGCNDQPDVSCYLESAGMPDGSMPSGTFPFSPMHSLHRWLDSGGLPYPSSRPRYQSDIYFSSEIQSMFIRWQPCAFMALSSQTR